jgi:ABC-type antimicrobial peptide transport system ATPase subunit
MKPEDCPILAHRARLDELSADMVRTLRQLRADLELCPHCPIAPEDCPVRVELNEAVTTAIQEVAAEWNLTAVILRTEA